MTQGWCLINGSQRVTRMLQREGADAVLRQVGSHVLRSAQSEVESNPLLQDVAWFERPEQGVGALTAGAFGC